MPQLFLTSDREASEKIVLNAPRRIVITKKRRSRRLCQKKAPDLSPWSFTLALYSRSLVLTKLIVFSPEAPRPTAANADQGACDKKTHLWVFVS